MRLAKWQVDKREWHHWIRTFRRIRDLGNDRCEGTINPKGGDISGGDNIFLNRPNSSEPLHAND